MVIPDAKTNKQSDCTESILHLVTLLINNQSNMEIERLVILFHLIFCKGHIK